jgi:hypothetical protein
MLGYYGYVTVEYDTFTKTRNNFIKFARWITRNIP